MRMNAVWLVAMLTVAVVVVVSVHIRPGVSGAEPGPDPFCIDPSGETECPWTPWPTATPTAASPTPTPWVSPTATPAPSLTVLSLDGNPATTDVERSVVAAVGSAFSVDLVVEAYGSDIVYVAYQALIFFDSQHLDPVLGGSWAVSPSLEQHGNLLHFDDPWCVPFESDDSLRLDLPGDPGIHSILMGCINLGPYQDGEGYLGPERLVRFVFTCTAEGTSDILIAGGPGAPIGGSFLVDRFAGGAIFDVAHDLTVTCEPASPARTRPRDSALFNVRDRLCSRLGQDHPACATLSQLAP